MAELESTLSLIERLLQPPELNAEENPELDLERIFDASFLAQVSAPQIEQMFAGLVAQLGACSGHAIHRKITPLAAEIRFTFERGFYIDGTIALSEHGDGKVVHLLLGLASRGEDSWEQLNAALDALPGRVSLLVEDLTSGESLFERDSDLPLDVASASKLVIFATLLDQLAEEKLRWVDLLELKPQHRSAPSGILHLWPVSSPITVHSAAVLLLSMSDNTAADLLLDVLGRDAVHDAMARMKVGEHSLARPFLSTRGLFNLVGAGEQAQSRYREASGIDRISLLAQLEAEPIQIGDLTSLGWPENLGWYFSAREIGRVLDSVRRRCHEVPGAKAIFAMNPGGVASSQWHTIGYKGGSSPGRLCMSAALENAADEWYAVCLTINGAPNELDQTHVASLFKRATDLAYAGSAAGTEA